jgi:TPR repeat protein
MKKLLLATLVALLMAGCEEDSEERAESPADTIISEAMKKLFEDYTEPAEKGDVNAQFNLGWHYQEGEGVPRDYVAAYTWWNIAQTNEGGFNAGLEQKTSQT